jgi:hypothetical protein
VLILCYFYFSLEYFIFILYIYIYIYIFFRDCFNHIIIKHHPRKITNLFSLSFQKILRNKWLQITFPEKNMWALKCENSELSSLHVLIQSKPNSQLNLDHD